MIFLIVFFLGEGVTIIDWMENSKHFVPEIVESYKYETIHLGGNSGTYNLLIHIVQCWFECSVDDHNQALPVVV